MIIIITITVKHFLERHFAGVQLTVFKNKHSFMKKTVLYTTPMMHCKTRQVLRNLVSTNQGNGSERADCSQELLKSTSKI